MLMLLLQIGVLGAAVPKPESKAWSVRLGTVYSAKAH